MLCYLFENSSVSIMAQVCHLSIFSFSVLYCRLMVASKDADEARREKAVAENLMDELRRRCSSLEKEKCEALEKLKESIEAFNIAKMQKTQVILFFSSYTSHVLYFHKLCSLQTSCKS